MIAKPNQRLEREILGLTIIVQAQNMTDRSNYTGYSWVITSPFFGQPTAVLNPRRVDVGLQFSF